MEDDRRQKVEAAKQTVIINNKMLRY